MTLATAERLAFDGAAIEIGDEAKRVMAHGRERFQHFMDHVGGYVYGSTTAAGVRAKIPLEPVERARRAGSLRNYCALRAGLGGEMLPERCTRLAVLARLTNAMTGCGKLRPETAEAIARMASNPPPVPLRTSACSGEVIGLTWLVAPLADIPLAVGEAMALVNGSPFATAMVSDVALTLKRRIGIAELVFALGIEAAQCPAAHFDLRLADHWPDPYYKRSLMRLGRLLQDSTREELIHQAPTSWRVLPNVLAAVLQALEECSTAATIALRALKDNPTFLSDDTGRPDLVVSGSGYHDHRSAKAIDQANSVMMDLGVLASRQVDRFLDGEGLGLPALLGGMGDPAGMEYIAWGLTGPLAAARRAAEPTTLDIGLHDPAGNQSDITGLTFVAYDKHLDAARAWDDCVATLALVASRAMEFRASVVPPRLRAFCEPLIEMARAADRTAAGGEPLRQIRAWLQHCAENLSSKDFNALVPDNDVGFG
ncbi:MAG: histidine ammonia-lyase [Gammaproteobacteria bacterium]|nr:histidine ammonia-lyase [Gammaproteobacteria bacterium]